MELKYDASFLAPGGPAVDTNFKFTLTALEWNKLVRYKYDQGLMDINHAVATLLRDDCSGLSEGSADYEV